MRLREALDYGFPLATEIKLTWLVGSPRELREVVSFIDGEWFKERLKRRVSETPETGRQLVLQLVIQSRRGTGFQTKVAENSILCAGFATQMGEMVTKWNRDGGAWGWPDVRKLPEAVAVCIQL